MIFAPGKVKSYSDVVIIHVKLAFRCIAYPQYVDMQTCQIDSIIVPISIEKEKY